MIVPRLRHGPGDGNGEVRPLGPLRKNWGDYGDCDEPTCWGQTGEQACGLNGRGVQSRTCPVDAEEWSDWGACDDPDQCVDGTPDSRSCGLNDRGTEARTCKQGTWTEWACDDPDECTDGEVDDERACGLNGRGDKTARCDEGSWVDIGSCEDRDVCTDGETGVSACGPGDRGTRAWECKRGRLSFTSSCDVPPGPCEGDVTISSSGVAELYKNCTEITGTLTIHWPAVFPLLRTVGVDLYADRSISAEVLERVGGDVDFMDLVDPDPLSFPALTVVAGDLSVGEFNWHNDNDLKDLTGLSALTTVGGSLLISGNNLLESLAGLEQLASVGGDLILRYNHNLADISALSKLTEIPGELMVGKKVGPTIYSFTVRGESDVISLDGLQGITSVGGDVTLADMELSDLAGLRNLEEIGGDLWMEGIGASMELAELPALKRVGAVYAQLWAERLEIGAQTIDGYFHVRSVGEVHCPDLTRIEGQLLVWWSELSFPKLQFVGSLEYHGDFIAGSFPELTDVHDGLKLVNLDWIYGFSKLQRVGGTLMIDAGKLEAFDAFNALTDVGSSLIFRGTGLLKGDPWQYNDELNELSAFSSLKKVQELEVGGFDNLPRCWRQDLALQVWPWPAWPDGDSNADLWGLADCWRTYPLDPP